MTGESPVRFATALRAVRARGYARDDLRSDAVAGITLGLVAKHTGVRSGRFVVAVAMAGG